MVTENRFYRKTHQQKRNLAVSQTVCKDGFTVEMPASCYNKISGMMKKTVLKDYTGHWTQEKVDVLVKKHGAVIISKKEAV